MRWLKQHLGELTIAAGLLHCALALTFTGDYMPMVREGWWNTISAADQPERFGWLWFTVAGTALIVQGILIHHLLRNGVRLPKILGWIMIGMGLLIGIAMPVSGAPLVIVLGVLYLTGGEPSSSGPVASKMQNAEHAIRN